VGPGKSGVPGLTHHYSGEDVRPSKSGVLGLMHVGPGQSGVPGPIPHPSLLYWQVGTGVRPGKSGVPGLTTFFVRGLFCARVLHSGGESSIRCARWISTGTALPSRSNPSPTVFFCRNLALIPSSTTASLKQPNAM
jgi:hypothetical protein